MRSRPIIYHNNKKQKDHIHNPAEYNENFSFVLILGEDDSGPEGAAVSGDEEETPKNLNIVSRSADEN